MNRKFYHVLGIAMLALILALPSVAWAWNIVDAVPFVRTMGFVPRTANNIGEQMDAQIMRLLGPGGFARDTVSISCTVPVLLDDLKTSSPLSRQMSEEMARFFMEQGYVVDDLRMGDEVVMTDEKGEFILTRDVNKLFNRDVSTQLLLVGTYVYTEKSVRFNLRLVHIPGKQIVAMSAGSVPLTDELVPMVADGTPPPPLAPSVQTKLPRR
jgi:hypothetical protein